MDLLRGLTVAFMILVNDPGDWRRVFPPLEHANWNGWTPTDLVFPNFLFLVGCSIVFSVNARLRRGVPRSTIALQMARRTLVILALQLGMALIPHFQRAHFRIFGVLPRIALCYGMVGLLFLLSRRVSVLLGSAGILLIGYWALLRFVPVPGFGLPVRDVPLLDPVGNLTSWIDRGFTAWTQHWLHTGVLYRKTSDPEGVLSTLPALGTTLLGVFAGQALTASGSSPEARRAPAVPLAMALFLSGLVCVAAGTAWSIVFPINKNLWTSSFVLLAGGFSLMGLSAAHWICDVKRLPESSPAARRLSWPLLVFGSNALLAYIVSEMLVVITTSIPISGSPSRVNLMQWIYGHGFAFHGSTRGTSFAFAVAFVCICFLPNWLLWRKRIFLRV